MEPESGEGYIQRSSDSTLRPVRDLSPEIQRDLKPLKRYPPPVVNEVSRTILVVHIPFRHLGGQGPSNKFIVFRRA